MEVEEALFLVIPLPLEEATVAGNMLLGTVLVGVVEEAVQIMLRAPLHHKEERETKEETVAAAAVETNKQAAVVVESQITEEVLVGLTAVAAVMVQLIL